MIQQILNNAEYVALVVNCVMFLAFVGTQNWAKAMYWLGTIFIVVGVIWMGKTP